eukprot:TCALIF_04413-PA protein Name:"Protein of unknown function" AED:0.00 eAED:0.00 QI:10/1/1/1/0.5/0.66/3/126/158
MKVLILGLILNLEGILSPVFGQDVSRNAVDSTSLIEDNTLMCFQCKSSSLEECRKMKYLQPCPSDQAYDRCLTSISKSSSQMNMTVTKKCALAPCFLAKSPTENQNVQCDISQPNFQCLSCCLDNACNGAISTLYPTSAKMAMTLLGTFFVALTGRRG